MVTIKDLDSFNVWHASDNISVRNRNLNIFSYNNKNIKKYYFQEIKNHIDTLWFEVPKYQFGNHKYKYSILKNNNLLDSDKRLRCRRSKCSNSFN